jgi:hypothetical protein
MFDPMTNDMAGNLVNKWKKMVKDAKEEEGKSSSA